MALQEGSGEAQGAKRQHDCVVFVPDVDMLLC